MEKLPDWVEKLYATEILALLEPQLAWNELHRLAGEGAEPALCCYERLQKEGEWCHRRIVANWLS